MPVGEYLIPFNLGKSDGCTFITGILTFFKNRGDNILINPARQTILILNFFINFSASFSNNDNFLSKTYFLILLIFAYFKPLAFDLFDKTRLIENKLLLVLNNLLSFLNLSLFQI